MTASPALPPLRAVISEPAEPFLYRTTWVLDQLLRRLTRQDWRHAERIPSTGGQLICANHISNFDPVALAHFVIWSGRWPRYLAKASLWRVPVIRTVVTRCGQIPIERHSADAAVGLRHAIRAVEQGRCVVVYPEGTITRDPAMWPMAGRTGAARIALQADVPVIPVGQWGAQLVMPGMRVGWPRLLPRKTMRMLAGAPVDLDDLRSAPITHDLLREATDRITAAITALVAELREEPAPAVGAATEPPADETVP